MTTRARSASVAISAHLALALVASSGCSGSRSNAPATARCGVESPTTPVASASAVESASTTEGSVPAAKGSVLAEISPIELQTLAARIVAQSAAVRERELVTVNGTPADMPLMEALSIEIRKRGAFPLLTVSSPELEERYYKEVPPRWDTQKPELDLKMAEFLSAEIDLIPEDEYSPSVAPDRVAKVFGARQGLHDLEVKRNIRQVLVGNELYPTPARAKRFGVSLETLAQSYWRGLAIDSASLREAAEPIRARLVAGSVLEIEQANGTHLTMRVAKRPVLVNDGELSSAKLAQGGGQLMIWLPAGEVYFAPVVESVEGTVVVDRMIVSGTRVSNLRMRIAKGRVVEMTGGDGFSAVTEMYTEAGKGKDLFAAVEIGTNPNVRSDPASWLPSTVAEGVVTVSIGRNVWAMGSNDVSFGVPMPQVSATVRIDGTTVVEKGAIVRGLPAAKGDADKTLATRGTPRK